MMKRLILCTAVLAMMMTAAWSRAEDTGRTVTLPVNAAGRKDYQTWIEDPTVTDILVSEGNEAFTSIDGVLFTGDGKELIPQVTGRLPSSACIYSANSPVSRTPLSCAVSLTSLPMEYMITEG